MSNGLSVKFPLSMSEKGDFSLNENVKDMVKQNFKNLLLTIPGERIMIPDFGVGISKYLFEQNSYGALESVTSAINSQVSKYMPYIQIINIDTQSSEETEELVSIKIKYFIKPLSESDILEITTT
jgi:phage baseplate assembly protein W